MMIDIHFFKLALLDIEEHVAELFVEILPGDLNCKCLCEEPSVDMKMCLIINQLPFNLLPFNGLELSANNCIS